MADPLPQPTTELPLNHSPTTTFTLDQISTTTLGIKNKSKTNREKITASTLSRTSFKATLTRVQYGTFSLKPACLIELDFWFHFENTSKARLRCTKAFIEVMFTKTADAIFTKPPDYTPDDDPTVMLFGPAKVWGLMKATTERESQTFMAPFMMRSTGLDTGIQYVKTSASEVAIEHRMNIQGSTVGDAEHSRDNIVRWKLEENEAQKQGIVHHFKSFIVVLLPQGGRMKVAVKVKPTVGFSVNPARWLLKQTRDEPIYLDGVTTKGLPLEGLGDFADPGFDWNKVVKVPAEHEDQIIRRETEASSSSAVV